MNTDQKGLTIELTGLHLGLFAECIQVISAYRKVIKIPSKYW